MSDKPSLVTLATHSISIQIGAGLVGLGLLFVVFAGLDAIHGRWTPSSQATLWMAACIALTGGVFVAVGVSQGRARSRVVDEGVSTEATVTAVRQSEFQTTIHDAPFWTIHYRYQDTSGHTFEGRSGDLLQEEAVNWSVGDKAPIRFDGRRPSASAWVGLPPGSPRHAPRLGGPPPSLFRLAKRVPGLWIGPLFVVIGMMVLVFLSGQLQREDGGVDAFVIPAICLLPGLLLFFAGVRRLWSWHRLIGHGVRATGTVSAVASTFGSDWSGRGVSEWQRIVQYRYEDDKGQAHQGRSGYLSSAEASRWQPGDACDIRFDREHPSRSVWIGA